MTHWKTLSLRDLGTWYGGGTPSKREAAFWEQGSIPWLSPKDMGSDVVRDTRDRITPAALEGSAVRLVPPGSVAVVVRSGILKRKLPVGLIPFATTLNQDMKALRCGPEVDPGWVAWGLRAYEKTILETARKAGTTVASMDWNRLLDWELPLPPLEEQRHIVAVLEEQLVRLELADAALVSSVQRLRLFEESTILSQILPATNNPLPSTAVTVNELPALPRGWSWRRLSEVAEVVGGVTKDANKQFGSELVDVPYLRVANVQRALLNLDSVASIRVASHRAQELRLLSGDVLMNEGGDRDKLARGWVWEGQIDHCIHQNHVFRARPRAGLVLPEWVAWCSNTYGARWAQRNGRQSVNLASISLSTIRRMPIPVPPVDAQRRALRVIAAARETAQAARSSLIAAQARSRSLRQAVLTAAFSGQLTGGPSDLERTEELAG